MTRTNFNTPTGQLEDHVKLAMFKEVKFFLVPTWLDQTLQAHSLSETILSDNDKLNSILTAEDIKFYNENISGVMNLKPTLPIPADLTLSWLESNKPSYGNVGIPLMETASYEENSIGRKERLSPFIEGAQSTSVDKLWNIVATYSINRLTDSSQVSIRLIIVPFEDVLQLQLKQDEKLAEFLIEELGLVNIAGTHLFKKLLEFKSCY